ncbi:MAG: hypothetical protein OZSIB_4123 [Candidatus Ozemobacter sibiricus]|jgi:hypothetical protein|uniref:Uncharacterized protein n=1 Tax=Candidatus Ozemobacter sibiricus TaxID=2268124 RepID=A0A367ZQM7_9BACT|nr:MAG: hypothetical protein OZSIB_4123 [Candidatus Ozemobacter sibiricus]
MFIGLMQRCRRGWPKWARLPRLLGLALLLIATWATGEAVVQAAAWVVSSPRWTDRDEKVYEDFVAALGRSKYGNLNKFIRDPQANPLYGQEDQKFSLSPDCADLPYLLRAYVAYKLRLPFGWTSAIAGRGGDQRYSRGNRPTATRDQDGCSSPQNLFGAVTLVNSGYYRMAPEIQDSDTYPVKIQRESIKPGTIYYDPNGHVAVVSEVTDDGRIRLIDAHPDRSISKPWFGAKFALGNAQNGGGFRRWRPQWYSSDGRIVRLGNHNIPDFSATDQYQKSFTFNGRGGMSYFDYVRARLSNRGDRIRPVEDFHDMLADVFEDIRYRAEAVEICIKAGIHRKPHPGALPTNIYGTDGEWEEYSTPSRDARLKVAFRDLFLRTVGWIKMAETGDPRLEYRGDGPALARELIDLYDRLNQQMRIQYINSAGQPVVLSFHDVAVRLFDLSFDPYHSIERRWGAKGAELATARDDAVKVRFYEQERRLRNQLERLYNVPTGLNLGPEHPVEVDIRAWLARYLAGQVRPETVLAEPDAASPVGSVAAVSPASPADSATMVAAAPVAPPNVVAPVPGKESPGSANPSSSTHAPPTADSARITAAPIPAGAALPSPPKDAASVTAPLQPPSSPAAQVLARAEPARPAAAPGAAPAGAAARPRQRSGSARTVGPPAWRFAETIFGSLEDLGVTLLEHSTLAPPRLASR